VRPNISKLGVFWGGSVSLFADAGPYALVEVFEDAFCAGVLFAEHEALVD
jgi:hypothetical protein